MRYLTSVFICAISVILPSFVFAYDLRIAPDINVVESPVTEENLYIASLKAFFDATYENDVISVSMDQVIKGTIFGDVILLGDKVSLEGEMFDDARIIANRVQISGVTNKDLVIVANSITIDKDAIINGDMLFLANNVYSAGQFLGESQITANNITIAGGIMEPATFTAQKLSFESGAKVTSDISYFSPQRADISDDVEILKPLNFNQIESIKQNDFVKKLFFAFVSFWSIIKLIATLFVIFMLTHLFRVFTQRVVSIVHEKKALVLPLGVLSLVIFPLTILLLFASLVLIPVSVILALMLGIIIILLPAMSAIVLGTFYQSYVLHKQKITIEFNISALVLIVLTFVAFIPYIGNYIIYALYISTFGAIVYYLYEQIRRKNIKL